jgi:DNA polymerase-3 subunit beta
LSAEDPADFPPVATFEDADYFVVPAGPLRTMIRRTIFATDSESTRYALGGIQMEFSPERLTLAATDSRRLAVVTTQAQVTGSPQIPAVSPVVPAKAMSLVEKSLGDGTGEVHIAVHQNDVTFRCQGITITSQLVQGRFPEYRKVVPTEFASTIDMVVAPFYSAVRQAMIVTNEDSRGVDFAFCQGNLKLDSRAAEIGQSKIETPISYDGQEMTIRFDPRYIADFLKVLDSGAQFHLKLIGPDDRATFATDDNYTYVVMPLSQDR